MDNQNLLSLEYIRGLVDGEGCFTFCPGSKRKDGSKYKVPTFIISMHERDQELLELVKLTLGLLNKVFNFKPYLGDGAKRGRKAVLIVREFDQLKDIIIPVFYNKLKGYKKKQFNEWLEKIGNDPCVSKKFKSLYRLYKLGIYDNPPEFSKIKKLLKI